MAYASGEGIGGLTDRLRAVSSYYGATDVPLYLFSDIPQLFAAYGENGAIPFVSAWQDLAKGGRVPAQLDVLILDTLHNSHSRRRRKQRQRRRHNTGCAAPPARRTRLRCPPACTMRTSQALANVAARRCVPPVTPSCVRRRQATATRCACEKLKDAEAWPALSFDLVAVNNCTTVRVFWQGESKAQAQQSEEKGRRR